MFLYVWALAAQPLTADLVAAFVVFTTLLVAIVGYVWRSGLLEEVTQ